MMATRRLNRHQTNTVLAGAMGFALALAVGFFVIAMPDDIFEALIRATGLPSVLAAAAPPFGQTARTMAAAVGSSIAGASVIALFLLTDRPPTVMRETIRPFSASSDFDREPVQPIQPIEYIVEEPLPVVDIAAEQIDEEEAVAEVEAGQREAVADETPIFLDFKAIRAAAQPANDAPLDLGEWKIADQEAARPSFSRPITAPAQIAGDEPIAVLMQRLEAGLERRTAQGSAPSTPPTIGQSRAGLRSTLDELRKMAVRS